MQGLTQEQIKMLRSLSIKNGGHCSVEEGLCVMEAVAYVAGEKHSDHPVCADTGLTRLAIAINDAGFWLSDGHRTRALKKLVPKLMGTRDDGLEPLRNALALDFINARLAPFLDEPQIDHGCVLGAVTEAANLIEDHGYSQRGKRDDKFRKMSLELLETLLNVEMPATPKPKRIELAMPVRQEVRVNG